MNMYLNVIFSAPACSSFYDYPNWKGQLWVRFCGSVDTESPVWLLAPMNCC